MTFEEFIKYYEDCGSPTLTKEADDTYKLVFSSDYFLTITPNYIIAHNEYAGDTRCVTDYVDYKKALDTILRMGPGEHDAYMSIYERDCEYNDYPLERDSEQQRFRWSNEDDPYFIAKTKGHYIYLDLYDTIDDDENGRYTIEWNAHLSVLINNEELASKILYEAYRNINENGNHTARLDSSDIRYR